MRRRSISILLALVVVLAACSSDGSEPDTEPVAGQNPTTETVPAPDDTQPPSQGGGSSGLPTGGDGTYSVDGESFDATVYRCEPFTAPGQQPDDRELSTLAYRGGSEGLEVEIGYGTGFGDEGPFETQILFVFHSRPGADGLEQFEGQATHDAAGAWFAGEIFAGNPEPLDGVPFTLDGNRLRGGPLTLQQTWPDETGEVVVDSWDLTVPDDTWNEC